MPPELAGGLVEVVELIHGLAAITRTRCFRTAVRLIGVGLPGDQQVLYGTDRAEFVGWRRALPRGPLRVPS